MPLRKAPGISGDGGRKAGRWMHWLQAWQYRRKVIIRISVGQQGQRRRCWPCTSTYAVMVGVGIPRGRWERVVAKTENRAPLMSSFNISITECFLIGCRALFESFFCGFPLFFSFSVLFSVLLSDSHPLKWTYHGKHEPQGLFLYSQRKFCSFSFS